jgi:hypothetical protein
MGPEVLPAAASAPYFTAALTAFCTLIVSIIVAWFSSKRSATFQANLLREGDRRKALSDQYRERCAVYEEYLRQWRESYAPGAEDDTVWESPTAKFKAHTAFRNARVAKRLVLMARAHVAFDDIEIAEAINTSLVYADEVGWQFVRDTHSSGTGIKLTEMNDSHRVAKEAVLAKISEARVALGLRSLSTVKKIAAIVDTSKEAEKLPAKDVEKLLPKGSE